MTLHNVKHRIDMLDTKIRLSMIFADDFGNCPSDIPALEQEKAELEAIRDKMISDGELDIDDDYHTADQEYREPVEKHRRRIM